MAQTSWLYAELFLYVHIVNVHASVSIPESAKVAVIEIAADGQSTTLFHRNERVSIDLPTRVLQRGSSTSFRLSSKEGNQFTLRLNVEDVSTKEASNLTNGSASLMSARSENPVPWTSRSMRNNGCKISCARCDSAIQSMGKVGAWLDMPNENWADLMEFWHCHKPAENYNFDRVTENIRNQGHEGKEYFAGNGFCASQGKGFIGTSYFLLHKDDCSGAKIESEECSNTKSRLLCSNCGNDVGTTDPLTGGWKLEKWSLLVHPVDSRDDQKIVNNSRNPGIKNGYQTALSEISEQQTIQKWISAHFLASAESGGARTYLVYNISTRSAVANKKHGYSRTLKTVSKPLLLWIFTLDLLFSSSVRAETRQDPTRAMKIFWKPFEELKPSSPESLCMTSSDPSSNTLIPSVDHQQYHQSERGQGQEQTASVSQHTRTNPHHQQNTRKALELPGSYEEIALPSIIFHEFYGALESSADYMPESSRKFRGWRVGLLERFRESECH